MGSSLCSKSFFFFFCFFIDRETNYCRRITWVASAVLRWLSPVFQKDIVSNILHLNSSHNRTSTLRPQLGSKSSVLLRTCKLIFLFIIFNDCWLPLLSWCFKRLVWCSPCWWMCLPSSSPPFRCSIADECSQVCVLVALVWNNAQMPVLPDLLSYFEALARCCAVAHHHQHRFCYLPPVEVFQQRTLSCFVSVSVLNSMVFWQLRLVEQSAWVWYYFKWHWEIR